MIHGPYATTGNRRRGRPKNSYKPWSSWSCRDRLFFLEAQAVSRDEGIPVGTALSRLIRTAGGSRQDDPKDMKRRIQRAGRARDREALEKIIASIFNAG